MGQDDRPWREPLELSKPVVSAVDEDTSASRGDGEHAVATVAFAPELDVPSSAKEIERQAVTSSRQESSSPTARVETGTAQL
jgi:hypothetical protein